MNNLSEKAKAFMLKSPTYIGTVMGHKLYEHPTRGDEEYLYAITPDGKVKKTCWYEMPSCYEIEKPSDLF